MRTESVEQSETLSSDFSQWGSEEDALIHRWSRIKPDPDAYKYVLVQGQFVRRVSAVERILMVFASLLALAAMISCLVLVASCLNTASNSSRPPGYRAGDAWYGPPP